MPILKVVSHLLRRLLHHHVCCGYSNISSSFWLQIQVMIGDD
ncbi:hypothetical protein MIZ03_4133 [Rhodoferax lithotrophicus]|uniref:Uncharacterized protein n=1 Tax=Rhodoferax lithotrophicus TaxID=2798804 RepID=A0ABN6DB63_9BURK|nr:hypothetical protein MIZ03_4133 [Rhodoferax sp. MIZ03]